MLRKICDSELPAAVGCDAGGATAGGTADAADGREGDEGDEGDEGAPAAATGADGGAFGVTAMLTAGLRSTNGAISLPIWSGDKMAIVAKDAINSKMAKSSEPPAHRAARRSRPRAAKRAA